MRIVPHTLTQNDSHTYANSVARNRLLSHTQLHPTGTHDITYIHTLTSTVPHTHPYDQCMSHHPISSNCALLSVADTKTTTCVCVPAVVNSHTQTGTGAQCTMHMCFYSRASSAPDGRAGIVFAGWLPVYYREHHTTTKTTFLISSCDMLWLEAVASI